MDPEATLPSVTYRGRRWVEFGAAAFFLFYFVATLFDPVGSGIVRWLLTGVMGVNGFHFLRRAGDPKPRLVLDEGGIRDRTSMSGSELFIPWAEVENVPPCFGRKMVEVKVRDLDRLRRETGWIRGAWLGFRRLTGKRTVSIYMGMLGLEKEEELTEIIEKGMVAFERKQLGFSPERRMVDPEPNGPTNGGG